MFDELLTKIFGSRNDRLIKQYRRKCDAIHHLEPAMQALSDDDVRLVTESGGSYVVRFRLLELWDALVQRLS